MIHANCCRESSNYESNCLNANVPLMGCEVQRTEVTCWSFLTLNIINILQNLKENFAVQVVCLIIHGRLLKQGVDFYSCYFLKVSKSNENNSACRSDCSFQCSELVLCLSQRKSPHGILLFQNPQMQENSCSFAYLYVKS